MCQGEKFQIFETLERDKQVQVKSTSPTPRPLIFKVLHQEAYG